MGSVFIRETAIKTCTFLEYRSYTELDVFHCYLTIDWLILLFTVSPANLALTASNGLLPAPTQFRTILS